MKTRARSADGPLRRLARRMDVQGRLMLLAMGPVAVFAIAWSVYVVQQRASDLHSQLRERAELLARQLATVADYGIFSGNLESLQALTRSVAREPAVVGVSIHSADRAILAEGAPGGSQGGSAGAIRAALFERAAQARDEPASVELGSVIAFLEPVRSPALELSDVPEGEAAAGPPPVRGYAVVQVSTTGVRAEVLSFAIAVLAILTGVLATGWVMARGLSRRIGRQLSDVARAAQRIGAGRSGVRIGPTGIPTYDRLSSAINVMAGQLEKSREELQEQVEQATAEMRAQRDAADVANRAKTRFLAAASHDLRQPMHALSLLVAALKQEHPDEHSDLVRRIEGASQSMSGLLDALLDVSRLDSGTVHAHPVAFELEPLLSRLRETYGPLAARKEIDLTIPPSKRRVCSDPLLLERIVGNFLSNAIRYTPHGGRVLVLARRAGDECVLQVRDNGPGIDPASHEAIFQEFVQLHNPQRDRSQGLGLGLAIVQRLARLLGHAVEVRSLPGRGATFSIRVPLEPPSDFIDGHATAGAAVRAPEPAGATAGEEAVLDGWRVLLVEDDAEVRESFERLLRLWRCDVRASAGTDAALASLAAGGWRPDLLVSDFRLGGGVDGLALASAVREATSVSLPVVLVTGDTEEPALRDLDPRVAHVLFKPVRPPVLRQLLMRLRAATAAAPAGRRGVR